jgi:hypothetical protein
VPGDQAEASAEVEPQRRGRAPAFRLCEGGAPAIRLRVDASSVECAAIDLRLWLPAVVCVAASSLELLHLGHSQLRLMRVAAVFV